MLPGSTPKTRPRRRAICFRSYHAVTERASMISLAGQQIGRRQSSMLGILSGGTKNGNERFQTPTASPAHPFACRRGGRDAFYRRRPHACLAHSDDSPMSSVAVAFSSTPEKSKLRLLDLRAWSEDPRPYGNYLEIAKAGGRRLKNGIEACVDCHPEPHALVRCGVNSSSRPFHCICTSHYPFRACPTARNEPEIRACLGRNNRTD